MGRLILFLVAAVGFTGLYGLQRSLGTSRRSDTSARQEERLATLARQAAISGSNDAVSAVAEADPAATTLPAVETTVPSGTARSTVTITPGVPYSVRIRTVGEARSGASRARHVVDVTLSDPDGRTGSDPSLLTGVPPYMRYAIYSGGTIGFTALPSVRSPVAGYNANIHANRNINMLLSLVPGAVRGFGTYAGSIYTLPLIGPGLFFQPPSNPTRLPSARRVGLIPFPTLDINAIASTAVTTVNNVVNGSLTIGNTITLGTRDNPRNIHVRGNLTLLETRIVGYGTFLVDGDIIVSSVLTGVLSMVSQQPESHVGYYAGGNILFNGLGDVQGQFVARGSVLFNLAPTIYGSISAGGDVNFLLAPQVRFISPSPALTTMLPGNPASAPLARTSYREWRRTG